MVFLTALISFSNEALKMSTGMDVYGQPIWYLVLCLMLAWIVVFFCLIKGIKSTGKVFIDASKLITRAAS